MSQVCLHYEQRSNQGIYIPIEEAVPVAIEQAQITTPHF